MCRGCRCGSSKSGELHVFEELKELPSEAINTLTETGCLICQAELVYAEQSQVATCSLCGESGQSEAACAKGHFVCDRCHGLSALEMITQVCSASEETDPLLLADRLMRHQAVKMHGPEHHFLVPAALIAAYCSVKGLDDRQELLVIARKRAEEIKGGFCGFHGACGAAVGAGIACSVLTGATPLAKEGWRLSNLMTAACLTTVAEAGGPRCCKRDTYLSLQVGRDFLNHHLQANLPIGESPLCFFSSSNRECLATDCRFFPPAIP